MMIEQVRIQGPASSPTSATELPVSLFSMILGMSGLGYAFINASKLWRIPAALGHAQLLLTGSLWLYLLLCYQVQFIRHPHIVRAQFRDPATGSMASLIGISTLVLVPGMVHYSYMAACAMTFFGISWQLGFSAWHGSRLWQGARAPKDTTPAFYIPDVAGNFTSAAALGVLGQTEWAWLFLGAGALSWIALEAAIKTSILHGQELPPSRRPLIGIQAAPSVVCAASLLLIDPQQTGPLTAMLLGYGLLQLLHGLRLIPWLKAQPFARSYWAYTFGMTSALNCCLKLAASGNAAARVLSAPLMVAVTAFIGYLFVRTVLSRFA